jgi:hypothetical protein
MQGGKLKEALFNYAKINIHAWARIGQYCAHVHTGTFSKKLQKTANFAFWRRGSGGGGGVKNGERVNF